jgi:NADH dehydrogenase
LILLTGATGLIGSALLRRLLDAEYEIRCLVRDPRRLGPNRVRVHITLGDLVDPFSVRQAVRGVDTVVHLAAAIRDRPGASIEEVNALGSARLLREARRAGARKFVFFSAIGATPTSRTRFFRAKALAEQAVLSVEPDPNGLETFVLAPSIAYAPGDPWLTLLGRMTHLPWIPVAGEGRARFEPIWAEDVAACARALVLGEPNPGDRRRFELGGPDVLSYDDLARLALELSGRRRPLVHVPMGVVRRGLRLVERVAGSSAFATWEEAELMEEEMLAARGTEDARALGVDPKPMREVLGLAPAASD